MAAPVRGGEAPDGPGRPLGCHVALIGAAEVRTGGEAVPSAPRRCETSRAGPPSWDAGPAGDVDGEAGGARSRTTTNRAAAGSARASGPRRVRAVPSSSTERTPGPSRAPEKVGPGAPGDQGEPPAPGGGGFSDQAGVAPAGGGVGVPAAPLGGADIGGEGLRRRIHITAARAATTRMITAITM